MWSVRFIDAAIVSVIHRIHICFDAEDPKQFVRRIAAAHRARSLVESAIKYSLVVDCMPTDDVPSLDTEQINRMLLLALNTKKLKANALDSTATLSEISLDYARTMNQITLTSRLLLPQHEDIRHQLGIEAITSDHSAAALGTAFEQFNPFVPHTPPVPDIATFDVANADFASHFNEFCFHSFLTADEAINALSLINAECMRLASMTLFKTQFTKSMRIDEFETAQMNSINMLVTYAKDKWIASLSMALTNSLATVGKGWLNLRQNNREVYLLSKMFKMMKRIRLMMEDAIRTQVETAVSRYAEFIRDSTDFNVQVVSLKDVRVKHASSTATDGDDVNSATCKAALFTLDLIIKDNVITYSTPPNALTTIPLSVFDSALSQLVDVPQLDSYVMTALFWRGSKDVLAAVNREEPHIVAHFDDIQRRLLSAVKPLDDWLALFHQYTDFLALQVDDYVKDHAHSGCELAEIRREVLKHLELKSCIDRDIPKLVDLGAVAINNDEVRRKLANKYGEIVSKLLESFAKVTKNRCEVISIAFKKIESEVKRPVIDIADLTKLKEYMQQVPILVQQQRGPIQDVMDSFELLESFNYRSSKELASHRWTCFAWPKTIIDCISVKELSLLSDRSLFMQEMKTAQEVLASEVLDMDKKIHNFNQYTDMDKTDKMNEKCIKMQEKLNQLQSDSRSFNSNELLFNLAPTDYRNVTKAMKNFEPFHLMWTTAYEWQIHHKQWLNQAFLKWTENKSIHL